MMLFCKTTQLNGLNFEEYICYFVECLLTYSSFRLESTKMGPILPIKRVSSW
jgi:hypothetical protein